MSRLHYCIKLAFPLSTLIKKGLNLFKKLIAKITNFVQKSYPQFFFFLLYSFNSQKKSAELKYV